MLEAERDRWRSRAEEAERALDAANYQIDLNKEDIKTAEAHLEEAVRALMRTHGPNWGKDSGHCTACSVLAQPWVKEIDGSA